MMEGQSALTPERERQIRDVAENVLALDPVQRGPLGPWPEYVVELLSELAREREATDAMREQRDFAREHERHLMGEADSLRGRVRDLQEALDRKARKYHAEVHGWRFTKFEYCDRPECVETREALVGLPERREP